MPGPPLSSSFGIALLRDLAAKRMVEPMTIPPPLGLLAELTHRCPLACPYCSNPLELERRSGELDTATWMRVFEEAAALGVLQLHLSGGEPASRSHLVELVRGAARAGLYTNLITSGIGLDERRLATLAETGLDHIQLSVQHVNAAEADRIAGYAGAHAKKRALARELRGRPAADHQCSDPPVAALKAYIAHLPGAAAEGAVTAPGAQAFVVPPPPVNITTPRRSSCQRLFVSPDALLQPGLPASSGSVTDHSPTGLRLIMRADEDGTSACIRVPPGILTFGVSPAVMNWPKVRRSEARFRVALSRKSSGFATLKRLTCLRDEPAARSWMSR